MSVASATKRKRDEEYERGWTAIRRGNIYCAPLCGCGCTYRAFTVATQRAHDLCMKLGPGWTPEVHENGGWHAAARGLGGHLRVTINRSSQGDTIDGYTAFLNPMVSIGGRWAESADTPEQAIANVRAALAAEYEPLKKLYDRIAKGYL